MLYTISNKPILYLGKAVYFSDSPTPPTPRNYIRWSGGNPQVNGVELQGSYYEFDPSQTYTLYMGSGSHYDLLEIHIEDPIITSMEQLIPWLGTVPSDTDFTHINTSNVTSLNRVFNCCHDASNPHHIDLSTWDVSKVTDFGFMFYEYYNLESVDFSNWKPNLSTFRWARGVFMSCRNMRVYADGWDEESIDALRSVIYNSIWRDPTFVIDPNTGRQFFEF